YLVRFDQDEALNSNTAVEKTYGPLTAALTTAEATFNDKPVLTLAASDTTWGKVTVNDAVSIQQVTTAIADGWGGDYTPVTADHLPGFQPVAAEQVIAWLQTIDSTNYMVFYYDFDESGNVKFVRYDGGVVPPTIETDQFSPMLDDIYQDLPIVYYTTGAPGVTKLTDSTYRVDYGAEVTVQADATELHHVANWEDQNGDSLQVATYSAYYITEPEPLFPDSSSVTFTVTTDTVARAMFGLNFYQLTFAHNEGGQMEFVIPQDSLSFTGIQETSISRDGITITADSVDQEGMFLKSDKDIRIAINGASITQVDFHVTNGTNLVSTISVEGSSEITTTQNNEYGSVKGLDTNLVVIKSSTDHDLQIDQLTVHFGRTLPEGVLNGPDSNIYYVLPDSTVVVRAIPADGHYLVNWDGYTDILDTLTASVTMSGDDTLTATFALNPVITLAVSDPAMGSVYFTGYEGNTVTRAGIIKAERVEMPYKWYEASEIMSIEGGAGNVTKDANSHYVIVNDIFSGTATVVTSTGAFNVTCEPTLPNGVHYNIAADNYTVMPRTEVSLTATPNADHYFVDWAKVTVMDSIRDSVIVSTDAEHSFRIDGDMKLQGNFLHNPYLLTLVADSVMGTIEADSAMFVTVLSDSTYSVMADSTVTLVANALTGYHITGWQNAQSTQNTPSNPNDLITDTVMVTMTMDSTVTISFDTNIYNVMLTVQNDERNGNPMGTVTGADSVKHFLTDTLTATAEYGYTFAGWYDADTNLMSELDTLVISPVSDTALTAMFTVNEYAVNGLVLDTLAGYVTGSDSVAYLDTVVLRAYAKTGYHFEYWQDTTGLQLGAADTLQIIVEGDTTVYAVFDTNSYQLTVVSADTVMGSVDSSQTAMHFVNYDITATPAEGYHFVMWTDSVTSNPRTVTLTSDSSFTAVFDTNVYHLMVVSADSVMGSVAGDTLAKHFVNYDIVATPNYGYHFVQWSDSVVTDTNTVTVTGDTTFTAYFDYNQYSVTGEAADTLMGSVAGSDTVNYLDTVTLVATANLGYHFVKWVDAIDTVLGTSDTLEVQALRDSVVYAVFDTNTYKLIVLAADSVMGNVAGTDSAAKHFVDYEISATANPGYHFVSWADGDTVNPRTVTLTSDSNFTAIFDYNPALTLVYDENKGHLEFIVETQTATFNSITTDNLAANGLTVVADSADAYGISLKNGKTLTITADSAVITQVAFHLTNGANKAATISANAGTVITATGNAYGSVIDIRRNTVVITSTSDKDINIDQLTIQYAKDMPDGVVRLASDEPKVYRVDYNTQVSLLAVPADSNYLDSWAGDTTSTNDLTAVVTVDSADATVYANFSGNPILTLAANGNGRVYFEGFAGYTVNRNESILVTNFTDFPHTWYEAGTITEINDTTGMVTKDQTNHYVSVHGAFNGTATVVTTSGSFNVTCIPTVPNGVSVMTLDTYTMEPGTPVTIVAEPEAEHYLVNWEDLDSALAVRDSVIRYNTTLQANFLHFPYVLTVNVDTVMGSAAPAEGQAYVTLNADGSYTVMADSTVTLIATADSGYSFMGWMDANDSVVSMSDTLNVTMVNDTVLTALMDTNIYQLIVLANDSTMGTVAGTDSTAKHFLTYNISATANPGYHFVVWSDGDSTATRTVSLTSDSVFTAIFDTTKAELAWSADTFTCYTLIDPNNWRPTLANPHGVEVRYGCVEGTMPVVDTTGVLGDSLAYGYAPNFNGIGTYHIYAVHDLTQEYFYDSVVYVLNVERGTIVTLTQNDSVAGSALFADKDSLPTLTHHYASGTMAFVAHGETVDVVAEPAEGYHFTAWQEGDLVNGYSDIATSLEYTYTVPDTIAAGLKAVFDTNEYVMNIAVAAANSGMGTVTGPDTVKHFLSGTYVATADTGYHFTGWVNEADSVVSMKDTLVVAPVSDTTLYATFDTNTYVLTVLAADSTMGSVAGSDTVKHFVEYTISATPATCYEFVAWSDGDSNATRTVTLTSDSTIIAEFAYTVRESYDTMDVCDTLLWNDSIYALSGDYQKVLQTAEGCDSTAYLHLTVRYSTSSLTTVEACESHTWHDVTYTTSTKAHFDTINAVSCDSIANLDLTINYNATSDTSVVTCDSVYVWNGITYVTSTIGTWHTTTVNGCDSTATLYLTLNNTFTGIDEQQHCYSYTWVNGVTYTESTDTATYVYQMENGCDSTVTLHLTISDTIYRVETVTACDSFEWHGVTYTASTNEPTYSTTSATGCDSIVTLNLTINNSVETSFDAATCSYYIWDGTYYNETGSYTKHYTAANGCDSTVTMNLTVNQVVNVAVSDTACGSYTWNDVTYTASGAYTQHFTGSNNCDSTVTLTLTVKQPTTATVTASACDSYTWHDSTYTETPAVAPTYTTTGSNGCDSVTTLQLTVRHATTGTETLVACDSIEWHGTVYTASNNSATYSTTNAAGCDSTVTLNLTIKQSVAYSFAETACSSYNWDGTNLTESGSYSKSYTAANGCDSIATLNLTISQVVNVAVSDTACSSYTWNGTTYATSGVYTQTFAGSNNCDSIVNLTLTINNPTTATVVASACDSYEWHGVTYTETPAEAPTYTTTGSNGCDSVTTLQLVIVHSGTSVDTVEACDSYTWIDGVTYTASTNEPTYTITGEGCNVEVTLNLTIKNSVEQSFNDTACNYYIWDGNYYNESGSYSKTYAAANGCDSTATLILTINQPVTVAISETACGSYTWNDVTYTASGAYTQSFTGSNGCDSTVNLTLTVKQPTTATVTASACESYEWHGVTYTETPAESPTYTTTGSNGCDSVTTLQLTVKHATTGIETLVACDSIEWHGTVYTASNNTATYSTTNAAGCDSTVTLNLTIKQSVAYNFADAACGYYIWNGTYYGESGSYSKSYTASNGCDSIATLTLTVNQPVTDAISETACGSYTWNNVEYAASGVYTQSFTGSNGCDSTVTLTLTVKQPVTATVTATACDSYEW
ncbi:MAG: InlB B-repeat-containing protein, partial [bacterium]